MPFFVTFEDGSGGEVAPPASASTAAKARAMARRAIYANDKVQVAQIMEGEAADRIARELGAYHAEGGLGAVWYPWKPRGSR